MVKKCLKTIINESITHIEDKTAENITRIIKTMEKADVKAKTETKQSYAEMVQKKTIEDFPSILNQERKIQQKEEKIGRFDPAT